MTPEQPLEPCPVQHDEDRYRLTVNTLESPDEREWEAHVECTCGVRGPSIIVEGTEQDASRLAIEAWNTRRPHGDGGRGVEAQAVRDVISERSRQIEKEGWTKEHDQHHAPGVLATAAACYALQAFNPDSKNRPPASWPWDEEWWKPKDRRRDLVRACALLLAEIERHDNGGTI